MNEMLKYSKSTLKQIYWNRKKRVELVRVYT